MARAAASFLQACGLTSGSEEAGPEPQEIHRVGARLVVKPEADVGYPCAVAGAI